jgi:alpha-mannosidase
LDSRAAVHARTHRHPAAGRFILQAALAAALIGLCVPVQAAAQEMVRGPVVMPSRWLPGYIRALSGEVIIYPWAYPGQTRTRLSRTTDGRMNVEWEGEAPPASHPEEPVTYLFHAGLASGYGAHRFVLTVNGESAVWFTSGHDSKDLEWTATGANGAMLAFRATRVGTFNELFGFMWVTLPRRALANGAPRFRVVGESAGSQDYFLLPEEQVQAWTRVRQEEVVLKGGIRGLRFEASHTSDPSEGSIRSGSRTLWTGTIPPGHTRLVVPLPAGEEGTIPVSVEIDGRQVLQQSVEIRPVRRWEIHLLPHSHIDIGYSDPQPAVERKQWKNLADAVALAEKTASFPPDARFRWNVEGLWSVESYLKQASPGARQAFIDAVGRGQIGLQANDTNILTGLASPEELSHWTDISRRLARDYGLPVGKSAMHSDIPGLGWPVVAALYQAGVRYFSSGPNYMPGLPDRGDRIGDTLKALGDQPFWWVAPSGKERLLFWMAGRGYSWFHGINMGRLNQGGRDAVLDYAQDLAEGGYPWDMVQVRYTIGGDNGPVDPDLPEIVRNWNETYDSPRLVINTADAMFIEFERRHGSKLPIRSGDMTPYWEDGAISTAAEETSVRASARRLLQAESLWALRDRAGFPAADDEEAWRNVILWHEHTWGAGDSIREPDRPDVVAQWNYKRAFATEADRRSRALLAAAQPARGQEIEIVNTLSWKRSGLVVLSKEQSATGDRVKDSRGRSAPSQRLADGTLAVWVADLPPFGAVRLRLQQGSAAGVDAAVRVTAREIDNRRVRVALDGARGSIASLRSAARPDKEFAAAPGLNRYVYVPGRDPGQAVEDRLVRIVVEEAGPLVGTLRIESDAPGTAGLVRRVTLVAGSDLVFLDHVMEKTAVRSKESAHVAFPFDLAGGIIRADQGAALTMIGRDELPGSCRDFIGLHSAIDVSGAAGGISLASPDAPLVEVGALTDERQNDSGTRTWRSDAAPGSTLYAYLLNNYWHTNYKADQSGLLGYRFVLRPHGGFDASALRQFSAEAEQPLVVMEADRSAPLTQAPFRVESDGVIVNALRPAGDQQGLLLRLYNPSGRPANVRIGGAHGPVRVSRSGLDGRGGDQVVGPLSLAPNEWIMVRLDFPDPTSLGK